MSSEDHDQAVKRRQLLKAAVLGTAAVGVAGLSTAVIRASKGGTAPAAAGSPSGVADPSPTQGAFGSAVQRVSPSPSHRPGRVIITSKRSGFAHPGLLHTQ